MRRAARAHPGSVLFVLLACVMPTVCVAEPTEVPDSPFLGSDGELRIVVRPEFRDAPGLLEDLRRFGIEHLRIDVIGPLVQGPDPEGPRIPSRLVLAGQPEVVARGREVLGFLDVPRPAVVVSLLVAEVACVAQRGVGGNVSFDRITPPGDQPTVFRGLFSEFEPEAYLRSSLSMRRPFQGTTVTFANEGDHVLKNGAFEWVLRALALEGRAEFLAWPTVVCTEGVPGIISSVVQTSQNVVESSSATNAQVRPRPLETGVRFEVTPVRVGSDTAVLDLVGKLSFALPEKEDGQGAGETVTQKRHVKTRVTIRDQESLLIGGLKVRRNLRDRGGLPVLTGIPGLTATSKDCLLTELVLLVRVRVIVPGRGGGVFVPPAEMRRLDAVRAAPPRAPARSSDAR